METNEIMKIPNRYGKSLDSCYKTLYSGQEVLDNFYGVGIWRDNYIPKELKDSNWIPIFRHRSDNNMSNSLHQSSD